MSFRSTQSLPGPLSMEIEGLHLGPEEEDAYFEVFQALTAEDRHQLLGHPDAVQGEMTEQCELVNHGLYAGDESGWNDPRVAELRAGRSDWRLLLQVASDDAPRMMWGDAGFLYYWIRDEDLGERPGSSCSARERRGAGWTSGGPRRNPLLGDSWRRRPFSAPRTLIIRVTPWIGLVWLVVLPSACTSDTAQSESDRKAAVVSTVERGWNRGEVEAFRSAMADSVIFNYGGTPRAMSLDQMGAAVLRWREALPDLEMEIEELVAEDEIVAARLTLSGTHRGRWRGVEPTGRHVSMALMIFFRFEDGKVVELWEVDDQLGFRRQLGIVP